MTAALPLPPAQAYQPATFRERGVAVPFTSPLMAGGRVRLGQRVPVELVMPNPSGGRGVYVLPWNSVRVLFHPSVHDNRLYKRIAVLPELTPASVRKAGQDMACQGLAGRQAMAAALAMRAKDEEEQLLTNFMLLVSVAELTEPGMGSLAGKCRPSLELERRARQVVSRIAPDFGLSVEQLMTALAGLTEVFSPIGIGLQSAHARVPRLLESLTELRDQLVDWAQDHADDVHVDLADMVAGFADEAVGATGMLLNKAWALSQDMSGLLRAWNKSPDRIIEAATRPPWLLDGWEQVCLLWNSSPTLERRRAVLTEMAQLVPVWPRELADWIAMPPERVDESTLSGISLNTDWRTGIAVLHLTARNERLRAFAN